MSTSAAADVVFCLDSSQSMKPCFRALRDGIAAFTKGLASDAQMTWDVRFDYISHRASKSAGSIVMSHSSLNHFDAISPLYEAAGSEPSGFFTRDTDAFRAGLDTLESKGDEANLIALDVCLDMPWRPASECHRVVIMLTDEPVETGLMIPESREAIPTLIQKIRELGVLLYIVGPPSKCFDTLSAAPRAEFEEIEKGTDKGLADLDLSELLSHIGKSVSKSTLQKPQSSPTHRALFGQTGWGGVNHTSWSGD